MKKKSKKRFLKKEVARDEKWHFIAHEEKRKLPTKKEETNVGPKKKALFIKGVSSMEVVTQQESVPAGLQVSASFQQIQPMQLPQRAT